MEKLLIVIPSKAEQKEIARTLELFEKKIAFAERKKQIYSDVFKTLLHQLMTGQLRVNEIEFEQEEFDEVLSMAAEPEAVYSTH